MLLEYQIEMTEQQRGNASDEGGRTKRLTAITSSLNLVSLVAQIIRRHQANNSNAAWSAAGGSAIGKWCWNGAANGTHHKPSSTTFGCSSWRWPPTEKSVEFRLRFFSNLQGGFKVFEKTLAFFVLQFDFSDEFDVLGDCTLKLIE